MTDEGQLAKQPEVEREGETNESPKRAFVLDLDAEEPHEQFRKGNHVWLRLPGNTIKYPMVVEKTRMNRDNKRMEYQLTCEGKLYNHGEQDWFGQGAVTER